MIYQKSSKYIDIFSTCFCWTVYTLSSFAIKYQKQQAVGPKDGALHAANLSPMSFKHDKEVQCKDIKFLHDGGVKMAVSGATVRGRQMRERLN